jgi:hypothetical protein
MLVSKKRLAGEPGPFAKASQGMPPENSAKEGMPSEASTKEGARFKSRSRP